MNDNEIILYQPDGSISLEVRVENETVWLNRQQMALLFDRDVKTIGKHINNALKEELRGIPTVANFATVQQEGERLVTRDIEYYNDSFCRLSCEVAKRHAVPSLGQLGASLKDLGKKLFAFSQLDIPSETLLS